MQTTTPQQRLVQAVRCTIAMYWIGTPSIILGRLSLYRYICLPSFMSGTSDTNQLLHRCLNFWLLILAILFSYMAVNNPTILSSKYAAMSRTISSPEINCPVRLENQPRIISNLLLLTIVKADQVFDDTYTAAPRKPSKAHIICQTRGLSKHPV
jgi:hypothetical protein